MGNKRKQRQSSRKLHLKIIRLLGGRPQKNGNVEDESQILFLITRMRINY
jgi:hypothetical protein